MKDEDKTKASSMTRKLWMVVLNYLRKKDLNLNRSNSALPCRWMRRDEHYSLRK